MINSSVLVLNRHYQPVHVTTVKRAFTLLYMGVARAMDRQMATFDFESWSALAAARAAAPQLQLELLQVRSAVGGGALPLYEPPSFAITASKPGATAAHLEAQLRAAQPPVIGRIADGVLVLDVRTVYDDDIGMIARALALAAGASTGEDAR